MLKSLLRPRNRAPMQARRPFDRLFLRLTDSAGREKTTITSRRSLSLEPAGRVARHVRAASPRRSRRR